MLCRRINKLLTTHTTISHNSQYRYLIPSRSLSRRYIWLNGVYSTLKFESMSSLKLKFILRDLSVTRLWNACLRFHLVGSVVKRCRRDLGMREVLLCFRHTIFRPRRTFLLSATAAYHNSRGDDEEPGPCSDNITNEELEALVKELDGVDELSRKTLFCKECGLRLVIDKKQPGVHYCTCKESQAPGPSEDGWVPYMEADDVIIWRKEYKPGQGMFAYKVYGRYKELSAGDFAAVQLDGGYRRQWDDAVAALSVVERGAGGVPAQAVLHWEVLWPRLFANRDYVYIRRHKEFEIKSKCLFRKDVFEPDVQHCDVTTHERPSVHSHAKKKSMESYNKDFNAKEQDGKAQNIDGSNDTKEKSEEKKKKDVKVYVIISKSCKHPNVPESKHAIRVHEYWSNMVIKTMGGNDEKGMEFVLTYYDEPSVGGLPTGVASWATGRAAPAFLARQRRAAAQYVRWKARSKQEMPDFTPFGPENVSYKQTETTERVSEEDMESFKDGPDLENGFDSKDKSTQTDAQTDKQTKQTDSKQTKEEQKGREEKTSEKEEAEKEEDPTQDDNTDEKNTRWWKYLYPFYYFV